MIRPALFLVCAVLATLAPFATSNNWLNYEYMNWAILPPGYCSNLEAKREILRRAKITQSTSTDDNLDKVWSIYFNSRTFSEYFIPQAVMKLSSHDYPCDAFLTNHVMEIVSMLHGQDDDSLHRFAQFLVYSGREKFAECSFGAVQKLRNGNQVNREAEQKLDRFFAALLNSELKSDEEMLPAVSSLDLAHDHEFKANKALQVALELGTDGADLFEIFTNFLNDACEKLLQDRTVEMHIVTLADAFGDPSRNDSATVKKLKEYNRLCASLNRPDKRQATEDNIKIRIHATATNRFEGLW